MHTGTTRKGQKRGHRRPTRRQVNVFWIRTNTEDYERTGNPVFAWDAIATCLAARIAFPPPIRAYLFGVAREMTQLSRSRVPSAGKIDRAVATAVGLKGGPGSNPFRELARPGHEALIAMQVYTCQTDNRHYSWKAIFEDVANTHHATCDLCKKRISPAKVKAAWYKHALSVIPPHLVNKAKSKKLDDILR